MSVPTHPIRKSVPTDSLESWWGIGWAYVMPDFDKPDHSIIEWLSDKPAKYPMASRDQEANVHADQLSKEVAELAGELRRA